MNLFRPSGARTFGEKRAKNTRQKGQQLEKRIGTRGHVFQLLSYTRRDRVNILQHSLLFFHFSLIFFFPSSSSSFSRLFRPFSGCDSTAFMQSIPSRVFCWRLWRREKRGRRGQKRRMRARTCAEKSRISSSLLCRIIFTTFAMVGTSFF